MRQLSGQDASFLYLDSEGAHLTLTGLYVYQQPQAPQGPLGFDDVYRHVESRLGAVRMFRQKLVRPPLDIDHPWWADDPDFDLAAHIHRYEGPAVRGHRQLCEAVASLHAVPLDLSRPPWQMHVFERLGRIRGLPENCFAIVTRYHHAAIDGASGSELVEGLHSSEPLPIPERGDAGWQPVPGPGLFRQLTSAAVNNVRLRLQLAGSVAGVVPGLLKSALLKSALLKSASPGGRADPAGPVPKTRFNEKLTPGRVFDHLSIDLDRIRDIRRAVPGATVNDVILAICGGGLRLWLEQEGELPRESLAAMVPVNLRSGDEKARSGNMVGMMFLPIHSDIEDSVARLRAVHRTTQQAKSADDGLSPEEIHDISSRIPALPLSLTARLVTGLGLGHRIGPLCNCTITNVPGPRDTIYLGPAEMVHTIGCGPLVEGMGLIISIFTYRGRVTFSLTSTPEMLPDPGSLARCLERAFQNLARQTPT